MDVSGKRVFITGANRGLGLALTRELIAGGHQVWGGARTDRPPALTALEPAGSVELDVADPHSVEAAFAELARRLGGLDVLINNAGIDARAVTAQGTGRGPFDIDANAFAGVLAVNTVGPMAVTRAALPLLRRGEEPLVLNVSSQLGSMELAETFGGDAAYCASKAALNMWTVKAASALEGDGITIVAVHPGWVSTDMGGSSATLSPAESARALSDLVDRLGPADSGSFLRWDGEPHPW